uniref:Odorant binding protein n=1 Tax=Athetis dissimilis TaxID=1737331 RepID=A0A4D6Q5W3_ATHDI|nr:odorant binding protein [Athetis dissimilis]
MFRQILLLFSIIYLATSEINKKIDENIPDQNRMMGIDAVHDNSIKIDKNTIITRNLKLEKRNRGQKAISNKIEEDQEPYWSYESFSTEVAAHVEQFKKNMSECLKEVQSNDKRPLKRLSPKMEAPVHEDCLIACVLKRNEIIANGKVNKGKGFEISTSSDCKLLMA